jgi:hypothetical protein
LTWRHERRRGASRFELAVVVVLLGLLAALLLQRLDATLGAARRVQLQMAAEQLRLQALVLELRCGSGFDLPCWQRLLAQRQTAPDQPALAETASAPSADARGQLRVLAQAAGLMAGRDEMHTDWLAQDLPGDAIQLALRTQPACRLVVKRQPVGGRIEMQVFLSEC